MKRFAAGCVLVSALLAVAMLGQVSGADAAAPAGPRGPVSVTAAPRIPVGATRIGPVPGAAAVTGAVVLRPRDEVALTRFIAAVTDPRSGLFHDYLPRGGFAGRFGPAAAAVGAVRSWLAAEGLHVTSVARDGLMVDFAGPAGTVERAFHTGLANYRLAGGRIGRATTSAVRVPTAIGSAVLTVVGLDNLVHLQRVPVIRAPESAKGTHAAPRTARFSHPAGSPKACADAQAAARQFGGLTDDQVAHAYGAFGLYGAGDLAAGQHIAIFEADPFLRSDIRTFDTCYFGAAAAAQMAGRLHVIPIDGGQPAGPGFGEADLDIENVSAMAPGADLDVYEAPNTGIGLLDQYAAIVNDDTDKVVTTSYGLCEQAAELMAPGLEQAENFLFQQAAAQGQSVFAASGDTGSDGCNPFYDSAPAAGQNPLSVIDPSSQPYVISVGGTTIDNAATQPPQEHVWNDGPKWLASTGGISMSWAMPAWQRDSLVPGIVLPGSGAYAQAGKVERRFGYRPGFCQAYLTAATAATACRTMPDVSADGDDFTGAITNYSASVGGTGWYTAGGTSSAAPIWAAMLALSNASPTCKANPVTASGVGFASPLLYAVASNPASYKASFHDITVGNNDIYGLDDGRTFPATPGYDLASGLGSPQLTGPGGTAGLAFYLCGLAGHPSRPAITGLSPARLRATGGTVTITGTGFERGGKPDIGGISVGTWRVPPTRFTVHSGISITATFPPAVDTLPSASPAPLDGAGPADVTVTLRNGQSSAPGPASTLQYVDEKRSSPAPSVTGVSPFGGAEASPTPVVILGSGFTGATGVTFGGMPAASFKVLSPFEIRATPPRYSSASRCAPSLPGQTHTTDICQAQVQVTSPRGASATGTILPPLEGVLPPPGPLGVIGPPPGCHCEVEPAPTEFDYVPAPAITSVSTRAADPGSLASEQGGTLITVAGKGFNYLTLDWADFGNPALASSEDLSITYQTGTTLQIAAPPQPLTTGPLGTALSVRTLAGQSPGSPVTFAGIPAVTGVVNTATGRGGGAADTGGTPIAIAGHGFGQTVGPLLFTDAATPFSNGTQYTYRVRSDKSISTQTVAQNPALVDVEVCSVTGCSHNPPADYFYLYPPGNPKVTSVTPGSGPAAGGTKVTIRGQNLGCVTSVRFGKVAAAKFSNAKAILDCGSTSLVHATAPPGKAGTTVTVTLTTVESDFTGTGPSKSSAAFTYAP